VRHDRTVGNWDDRQTNRRFRVSAWLPPGLALGLLAVLAAFLHSVSELLTTWAATVASGTFIALVLARSRARRASAQPGMPATGIGLSPGPALGAAEKAIVPVPAPPNAPVHVTPLATSEMLAQFRVLTAAEVADVLRVDTETVTTAILNGEFPGNRLGSHWRIDQDAVVRWLHGSYKQPGSPTGSAGDN
jgi:excisionase family DNA binding protein